MPKQKKGDPKGPKDGEVMPLTTFLSGYHLLYSSGATDHSEVCIDVLDKYRVAVPKDWWEGLDDKGPKPHMFDAVVAVALTCSTVVDVRKQEVLGKMEQQFLKNGLGLLHRGSC